jgi:hypothetical protein
MRLLRSEIRGGAGRDQLHDHAPEHIPILEEMGVPNVPSPKIQPFQLGFM